MGRQIPKTKDLLARRQTSSSTGPDSEAWLKDIRDADPFIDDEPLTHHA
jgi:hypothetical protein